MSASQIVWLIVAVVVFVVVLVLVLTLTRRSGARRDRRRERAANLREDAARNELDVREREAASLEARAQAERAEVAAARLMREAEREGNAAHEGRAKLEEQLRKADRIDPDTHRRDGHDPARRAVPLRGDTAQHAESAPSRTATASRPAHGSDASPDAAQETRDPDIEAGLDARRRADEDQPGGQPSEGKP
ncbi:hypothetical protein SPF06_16985 [Sinomonas sp. JGH33]|uniref:Uncharacterized protein n=1 Tax=Sinomonas terricola TaxID=3110330 RepID=A0ABU5T9T1_9MICC|nr:hypothetical protein [Sinomonas sp. JGH33]MEA5456429.1 hypothetical protein [Sinomonas sp. JGH33]